MNKKQVATLTLFLTLLPFAIKGQENNSVENLNKLSNDTLVLDIADQMPEFPGGAKEFLTI